MNTTVDPEDARQVIYLLSWLRQFYGDARGWINRALDLREAGVPQTSILRLGPSFLVKTVRNPLNPQPLFIT
jgi:hypothetical protein